MLNKLKVMSKKAKILISVFIVIALSIGAGSIVLYANNQQQKEELRQTIFNAYWSLKVNSTEKYNTDELELYNKLIERREQAFTNSDVDALLALQSEFDMLHTQVQKRIELDKKYDEKQIEVEAVQVLENATQEEQDIFNQRKQHVFNLIKDKKSFDEIAQALNELNQTNIDIQNRINAESVVSGNDTNNYNYDYGYYPSGGASGSSGSSGGSSGGSSQGGGSGSGSSGGGGQTGGGGETCVTKPNGAVVCVTA